MWVFRIRNEALCKDFNVKGVPGRHGKLWRCAAAVTATAATCTTTAAITIITPSFRLSTKCMPNNFGCEGFVFEESFEGNCVLLFFDQMFDKTLDKSSTKSPTKCIDKMLDNMLDKMLRQNVRQNARQNAPTTCFKCGK